MPAALSVSTAGLPGDTLGAGATAEASARCVVWSSVGALVPPDATTTRAASRRPPRRSPAARSRCAAADAGLRGRRPGPARGPSAAASPGLAAQRSRTSASARSCSASAAEAAGTRRPGHATRRRALRQRPVGQLRQLSLRGLGFVAHLLFRHARLRSGPDPSRTSGRLGCRRPARVSRAAWPDRGGS